MISLPQVLIDSLPSSLGIITHAYRISFSVDFSFSFFVCVYILRFDHYVSPFFAGILLLRKGE